MGDIVFNIADFTDRFDIRAGTLFILRCPVGTTPKEVEAAAEALSQAMRMTGACAIALSPGMTLETFVDQGMEWLAKEGLALRGYPVPGSEGEVRYKVLHPKLGQLSDEPTWPVAIHVAKSALSHKQDPPPPPAHPDSEAALRAEGREG